MNTDLGASNATLTIHTGRAGMAAKAGHDLLLFASRWSGSLRGVVPEKTGLLELAPSMPVTGEALLHRIPMR